MSVSEIIKEIRSNNSKLFKESVLKREVNNSQLKAVLLAAYDPNINYHIKKIPEYSQIGNTDIGYPEALNQLNLLANRTFTGKAGVEHLRQILSNLPKDKAEIIELIIARDMKAGFSETTINKVWKGLIPETPYMRCSGWKDFKNADWKQGLISQLKADGSFVNIQMNFDGSIELFTRSGKYYDLNVFPTKIIAELQTNLKVGFVYNGELLIDYDGEVLERKLGNGILNSVANGSEFPEGYYPVVEIWDLIPISEFKPKGKYEVEYRYRLQELNDMMTESSRFVRVIETQIVYSLEEALDHYKEQLAKGLEGTILKLPNAIWKDGTSKEQFKLKLKAQVELEVIGFTAGSGRNLETFGALECQSSDGLLKVDVSGRGDDMRGLGGDYYVGKIITVESNAIMFSDTKAHSLFLPIFIEVRDDKKEADSFQKIKDQFESLIK